MMRSDVLVSPSKISPASKIKLVRPRFDPDFKKCEVQINIGIFFDGTNNNMERDAKIRSDTNIVRLYDTYKDSTDTGYSRLYVSSPACS